MKRLLTIALAIFPTLSLSVNVIACNTNNQVSLINEQENYLGAYKLAFTDYKTNLFDQDALPPTSSPEFDVNLNDGSFYFDKHYLVADSFVKTYDGKQITLEQYKTNQDTELALDSLAKQLGLAIKPSANVYYDFSNYTLKEDYSDLKYYLYGIENNKNSNTLDMQIYGKHTLSIDKSTNIDNANLETYLLAENDDTLISKTDFVNLINEFLNDQLFADNVNFTNSNISGYDLQFNGDTANLTSTINITKSVNKTTPSISELIDICEDLVNFINTQALFTESSTNDDVLTYANKFLNNFDLEMIKVTDSSQDTNNETQLFASTNESMQIEIVLNNNSDSENAVIYKGTINLTNYINADNAQSTLQAAVNKINFNYLTLLHTKGTDISAEINCVLGNLLSSSGITPIQVTADENKYTISATFNDNALQPITLNIDQDTLIENTTTILNYVEQAIATILNASNVSYSYDLSNSTIEFNQNLLFKDSDLLRFIKLNYQ